MYVRQIIVVISLFCICKAYNYYISNYENKVTNGSCTFDGKTLTPCGHFDDVTRETAISLNQTNISFILLPLNYSIYKNLSFDFSFKMVILLVSLQNTTRSIIHCNDGDISLYFYNISEVTINSIEFHHCGKSKPVINVADVYEKVNVRNVIFTGSASNFIKTSGTVSEINIVDCVFERSTEDYGVNIGSHGFTVVIADTMFNNCSSSSLILSPSSFANENSFITIINSTFANNEAITETEGSAITINSAVNVKIQNCLFVNNSGGSALLIENSRSCLLMINDSVFVNNTAENGGALAATSIREMHIDSSNFDRNVAIRKGGAIFIYEFPLPKGIVIHQRWVNLTINSSNFTNNIIVDYGGAVAVQVGNFSSTRSEIFIPCYIKITDSYFYQNSGNSGSALYLKDVLDVTVRYCYFLRNQNKFFNKKKSRGGAILTVQNSGSRIFIHSVFFINNKATLGGSLYFVAISTPQYIAYIQNSKFESNNASSGGALSFTLSNITIVDTIISLNEALQGGAVFLKDSILSITRSVLERNLACTGGGIYSSKSKIILHSIIFDGNRAIKSKKIAEKSISITTTNCNNKLSGKGGGLYIDDDDKYCNSNLCPLSWYNNSRISYSNNVADMGSLLFGGMISLCYSLNQNMAIITRMATGNTITSKPMYFCYEQNPKLRESRKVYKTVYSGQKYNVTVACLDQAMQIKKCRISSKYTNTKSINLHTGEQSYKIEKYENLTFHAYSRTGNYATLEMTSDIFCIGNKYNVLKVYLTIKKCPIGFQKVFAHCQCDRRLEQFFETIKCDIDYVSISIGEKGWFGYDEEYLRIHSNCLLNYCSQEGNTTSESYPHSPCANNRGGILCGQCIANYSIVIGSWKCEDCTGPYNSYNFIWLTIVLALAGVVLVVFLLLIKMTVSSGTTNGLILYANIMSFSGLLDLRNCSINPVLRVFLSWINLDLGIEVCYYSGMDVYQKTWLQFIFPFYIWFLVGVIILFCHYSSRVMKLMGMRNIEVLATLFLLSYAKLLKTIITILSFTTLKVANASYVSDSFTTHRVWLYDAHIDYLSSKHLPLFIVAVICLLLLFIPYTVLLLFGQCLPLIPKKRGLNFIHGPVISTILDAYFAPYNKHTRFWTGLCLLLRCVLFALFGTSYSINSNVFWIVVSVGLLFLFRLCYGRKIYGKKVVDLVEVIILSNLGGVALILIFKEDNCWALTTSTSLSFTLFIGLLCHHIYSEVKRHFSLSLGFRKLLLNVFTKKANQNIIDQNKSDERDCHFETCTELRESLLDS